MRHCVVSMCNLCLLEDHLRVALEKGLCNCITCRALGNVLDLKYCLETTSELDPLLSSSLIKERCGAGCIQAVLGQVLGMQLLPASSSGCFTGWMLVLFLLLVVK
eukprot:4114210-Ditylum_brightwellii.AAC.1